MWFCPGANHAPHHAPKEYIDKYKGKFDDGYEAYREWVLPRMIEKGVLPKGTKLTPINPLPRGHGEPGRLGASVEYAQRRREEAVLAHGRGLRRLLRVHRRPGRPHHRLPGADRAARQHDRLLLRRQRRLRRGQPERLGQREQVLQRLPGRALREHEATSTCWAARTPTSTIRPAGPSPSRRRSRCSSATRSTPAAPAIRWSSPGPRGSRRRGEVRHQYHHSTDIVPTILDVCGLEMPEVYSGVEQYPLSGVSMRYSFDARRTRRRRRSASTTRCSARAASGRTAGRPPPSTRRLTGKGHFDQDDWELYHVDEDRSESKDLAKRASREAQGADQGLVRGGGQEPRAAARRPHAARACSASSGPPRSRRATGTSTIPGTAPVPEGVAVNVRGRSYKILADVEITDPTAPA